MATKRKELPAKRTKAAKKVRPIPAGYHAITPYLAVRGGAQAIEFYKKAFGAKEIMRMPGPDGKLGHAEVLIGGSHVMLSDEYEQMSFFGPQTRGGTTVVIHLYVKDVDATVARAVAAGGKVVRPLQDQFYGDRTCSIEDPFGHMWYVATHTNDLSMAEIKRGAKEAAKKEAGG
jgi:PhnB protein